jgi:predicted DCC family thiol-disulfide oxidoreductase YuxK
MSNVYTTEAVTVRPGKLAAAPAAAFGRRARGVAVFEVFFDSDCPLCMREIRMLQRKDTAERITFTDISAPGFDAAALGLEQAAMMAQIYGRMPGGDLVTGVEVFRQLYAAVGFGPIVRMTRWWGVSGALDLAYKVFAKNRLWLTGRDAEACANGACTAPGKAT